MADEQTAAETAEQPASETPAATQTQAAPTETVSKAEYEKLQAALKAANAEAAKRRKDLEKYEQEANERKEAEMTELQKLQAQLEKLQRERDEAAAELAQRTLNDTKREIAAKVGLPPILATRIQGDTAEAMEADAKTLLAALPKPEPPAATEAQAAPERKPSPKINPTNPGGNATAKETPAQTKARLYGQPVDPFDPAALRAKGGGAFILDNGNKE